MADLDSEATFQQNHDNPFLPLVTIIIDKRVDNDNKCDKIRYRKKLKIKRGVIMQIPKLSKSEREIMSVFWAEDRPLSSAEIVELSPNKTWRANSIHMFLNNLLDKKAICLSGVTIRGKHASRTFEAAYSESEGTISELIASSSFRKEPFKVMATVVSSLAQEVELTDEQRDELSAILKGK